MAEVFRKRELGKIAIVGASVRAAAQSALRAGYSPVAADLFADADLRRICPATQIANYPDGLCDWLAQQDVDGWFYTGALENYPDLIDRMAAVATLWGNAGSTLRQVRSPLRLQKTLTNANLLFPETQVAQPHFDGPCLAKTYRGSSGCGVSPWDRSTTADDKFDSQNRKSIPNPPPPSAGEAISLESCGEGARDRLLYYQRFIEGTPISALFVAAGGGVHGNGVHGNSVQGNSVQGNSAKLLGITKQLIDVEWTHAQPFQYAGSIGPWTVSNSAKAKITRTGDVLAREFNLAGLFGVDMILRDDVLHGEQVWTLEVNPRYTASVEVIQRTLATSHQPAGKAILFAQKAVEVSATFSEWASEWALQGSQRKPWPDIGDVPAPDTQIEAGQPVLTVFAQADCVEEVEHQLRRLANDAESRLYR